MALYSVKRRFLMRFCPLLIALTVLAAAEEVPRFEQFKVAEKFTGKPADPVLRTRVQKNFRTA